MPFSKKLRMISVTLTVAVAILICYRWILNQKQQVPIPVLGEIDKFELVDQDERSYTKTQLFGNVTVVNFIFTRCPGVCPLLTQQMAKIQERLELGGSEAQLVSISVDPERDTPQVLKKYAAKYKADHARWHFLTGQMDELQRVVIQSFKTMMGAGTADQEDPDLFEIVHGENFVILDRQARIRAFAKVKNREDVLRLLQIVERLELEREKVS